MNGQGRGKEEAERARRWSIVTASFLLGLVASALPARWRGRSPLLQSSLWGEASLPSALLQVVLGIALFAAGYVAWMKGLSSSIDAAAEATRSQGGDVQEQQILGTAALLANPILPFLYAFTTPAGFLLGVAACSGLVRLLHGAVTREVMPDPVLAAIDWASARVQRGAAADARERSKDRSPDRLVLGSKADGFAMLIESATDFDWREGNTIIVAGAWYRLVSKSETHTPAGLRLRYVLEDMPQGIALRGVRRYDPGHAPVIASSPGGG